MDRLDRVRTELTRSARRDWLTALSSGLSRRQLYWSWLLAWITFGLAIRLYLVVRSGWRIDYDEAMIGLLGLHVMRGESMVFIPGQPTLGAVEAYLLAPLFALLGPDVVTFRLFSLLMSGAYILTTSLVATYAFDRYVGGIAALLAAAAPPYMIITGLKTWGGTIETIVLGNLLFLIVAMLLDRARPGATERWGMAAAGATAGLMFWLLWLGAYYFLPVALLLLWRGWGCLRRTWWIGLATFFAGSAPFWVYNLRYGYATFSTVFGSEALNRSEFDAIREHFREELMPLLVTGDSTWWWAEPVGGSWLFYLYYAGAIGLLVWPLLGWRRRRAGTSLRWMLGLLILAVPAIYLHSGYSRNALNPWDIDATGRYVLMLHSALPIGIAALAVAAGRLRRPIGWPAGVIIILLVVAINLANTRRVEPSQAFASPYYDRLPATLDPLIDHLDREGIAHVWTDVGIAHVLMFETRERILAADYYDIHIKNGLLRFPGTLEAVKRAPSVAFVEPVLPQQEDPPIIQALDAADVDYTKHFVTDTLLVIQPTHPIDPAEVAAGLGYQY